MFKTRIKEKYRTKPEKSSWNVTLGAEEYTLIAVLDDMCLLFNEKTHLLVDVYSNKVEDFSIFYLATDDSPVGNKLVVKAKNQNYADRFNLSGEYTVKGYTKDGPTKLRLTNEAGEEKYIFPSRLRVVRIFEDGQLYWEAE